MVASVARVRLLVVVMRSVNQTYGPDKAALSAWWTAVDSPRRRVGAAAGRSVTSADKADRCRSSRPVPSSWAARVVAKATVVIPAAGGRLRRNKVAACLMS
ncbi:hypothetical protein GCM10010251_31390 [Streptomyces aurantiogriseus]|uniref:Uncharacterized protein n=1 Tax=Streptomyces aurantiogriseus TaxID=66870 RepID=A0A918F926_9ACTN|nr:hypothetical protein GCM10010251_31390 [Streptomyces aurantiogriseus]